MFATTALVLSAGVAAADMKLGGNGRMGITYNDSAAEKTQFDSRFRAVFTGSGTTDAGIAFGGTIRADNAANGASGTAGNVFVSGTFGKVTMGDISSALDNAAGNLSGVGYTGLGDHSDFGWSGGGDDEGVLWSYTAGTFGLHASVGQRVAGDDEASAAVTFAMAPVTVGVGVSQDGGNSQAGIGLGAEVSGADVKFGYLNNDNATGTAIETELGLSVAADLGGVGVTIFARQTETAASVKAQYLGVGFSQSLGGGATIAGGIVDADGTSKGDLGLTFSF
jgi:outer membrane protein OmpU